MLKFLPAFLVGIIAATLYFLNMLLWPIPVFIFAFLRLLPIQSWQRWCYAAMTSCLIYWADCNKHIQTLTTRIEWDVQGTENLKPNDWYLLISNHRSWIDILVLIRVFNRKIPSIKFFMKKELLWMLPVAGVGAWLLDFPIMRRHSKSFLAKHPEMKGKDLETTRKNCEKFKTIPTTIINFAEGTRFTPEKQQKQASPYQYLLRPKVGGIAFALDAMGQCFHKILNVTIIYPDTHLTMWDFACGRHTKIIVRVEEIPITPDLIGDYENDRTFRVYFQNWINNLWQRKDELIAEVLKKEKEYV